MKIVIDRKTLVGALAEVAPFAPSKPTVMVLKYAKVVTKGNRVKFEANDGTASVRKYIEAIEIDHDGEFLVDIAMLSKFIGKVKGDTVELCVDDSTVIIKHPNGKAELHSMPATEYPMYDMPTEDVTEVVIPAALLAEAVTLGRNFCGSDDLRPQMKPIYAYIKDGEFGYCATDTRKLIADHNHVDGLDGVDVNWFIEQAVHSAIINACRNADNAVIKIAPAHVSYRLGNTVIQTLQTKGRFPDFNRVIPPTWNMECAVDKSDLIDTLSRVGMFCDSSSQCVKFDITRIDMTVSADDITTFRKSSETVQHNGCGGEIVFGAHNEFAQTCLKSCAAPEVQLCLTDHSRPILFGDAEKPNKRVLLMPMTVVNN